MEQSLEHLIRQETLAALGTWDGIEKRLLFVGTALQLLARLYPSESQKTKTQITQRRR